MQGWVRRRPAGESQRTTYGNAALVAETTLTPEKNIINVDVGWIRRVPNVRAGQVEAAVSRKPGRCIRRFIRLARALPPAARAAQARQLNSVCRSTQR